VLIAAGACTPAAPTPSLPPTATLRGRLTPYVTPSGTPTALPAPLEQTASPLSLPLTPAPSPTPALHTIARGDTLLTIAYRYGIALEDLKLANPDANPNLLIVGQQLVIPLLGPETPTPIPTPTPAPVVLGDPRCYPSADGGVWCLLLGRNDLPQAVESLSAWVGLYSVEGEVQASAVALPPLNRLESGDTLPLSVYFPAPASADLTPRSSLLTAFTVPVSPTRYLTATLQIEFAEISPSSLTATVAGQALIPAGRPQRVWIAVTAYDAGGSPVGVRKWEASGAPSVVTPLAFNVTVYSLGPPIARVAARVEANP